jgi:disulfide bond formation protein DsbB
MPDISVDLVERFYAILAIAAIGGMILLGTLRILAIQSDPALDAYATIATIGSLFFSEIAKFTPCTLCWYQRIAMYPLVVILGMAMLRRQRRAPTGTVALAAIGAAIAAYHVVLEWIPAVDTGACAVSAPCTFVWFRVFGVFSLPTLALTAFLLILTLLLVRDPDGPDRWSAR